MGWIITLGVLICLAVLPIGVSAIYNVRGACVYLLLGFARIKIYPAKKKKREKTAQETKKSKAAASKNKDDKSGGSLKDFYPIVDLIYDFLAQFRRKLRVDRLELKWILAGDDPCDLAVNYGKAWAAIGSLMPQLERYFVIKKRNVEVECDFTADKPLIFARLDLSITIGRILSIGVVHGYRLLREYLKIMKLRKGGAKI